MYHKLLRSSLLLTLIAIVVLGLSLTNTKPTNAAVTWALQWSDEFNAAANTGANTSNWIYDTGHCYPGCPAGNWGTGEIENLTTSTANVFHDGSGHLVIKPIRDAAGNWTSGRIETVRTDFQPAAGKIMRVEASLQQPNVSGAAAAGYWPAFWMLGAPFRGVYTNWPSIGELDIMEDINGRSSVFGTLHCGVGSGGPCNETTGLGSGEHACAGCQTGFHTYAIEYDKSVSPQQLRWYLDGVNYFTINANQVDATTWNNATNHGFFAILNVAIGGGFPGAFGGGPTASTVSGIPMLVDYVRVYYSTTTGPTPTPVTPTAPPPPGSNTFFVRSGGALSTTAGTGASTVTVASAGGGNHDGTVTNPQTFVVTGVNGTYNTGNTNFDLYVDSGAAIANGVQVKVSYDFTNNGSWDRTETYNYFATNDVSGFEDYNQTKGLKSSTGAYANLANGKIQIQVWSAIGNASSSLRVNATSANGQQSKIVIPFK
jgi:hypothetical protein